MNSTVGSITNSTFTADANSTLDSSDALLQSEATYEANITAIANALRFVSAKSTRTSTVILASFNAFAALITAVGIIHACRTYNRRIQRRASDFSSHSRPQSGLFFIHTVEVFPLILSLGITLQSITFAAAQSTGLQALLSTGCGMVAVFMLPAVFITPVINLVFGIETAFRGFRSNFAPRGKWTVGICNGLVGLVCVLILVVAAVDQGPDLCFAALFWFVNHYATGCFASLAAMAAATLVTIGLIFLKLRKSQMVSPTERLAAQRMVYYLALGFIYEVFILPFFYSLMKANDPTDFLNSLNLAMVAAVVSNVNGLMVAGLHLFLRSKSNPSYQNFGEHERKEDTYRDPYRLSGHSLQPVSRKDSRPRSDSHDTLLHGGYIEERGFPSPLSYGTARSPFSSRISIPSNPAYPEPTQPPSETSPSQVRKQSYSLYGQDSSAAASVLPTTTYYPKASKPSKSSGDTYKPPPIVKPWMGRGHKRDSSITSTATVQIGIRFSNVDDYVPHQNQSTESLVPDIPLVPKRSEARPKPTFTTPTYQPSPLADFETRYTSTSYPSEIVGTDIILGSPPRRSPLRDGARNVVPAAPKSPAISINTLNTDYDPSLATDEVSPVSDDDNDDREVPLITLSPTVYQDPVELQRSASNRSNTSMRKLPSPMGVGFSTPIGQRFGDPRVPPLGTPRPLGCAAPQPLNPAKGAWI